MIQFHHIGIFVKSLAKGKKFFKNIIKVKKQSKIYNDKNLGVTIIFLYDKKNICYEIVAPLTKKNPVEKVLKSKNNLLNHVAYVSDDFANDIKKLRSQGCAPLTKVIKAKAFDNKNIIFFLTTLGFIMEIIEK